MWEYNLSQIIGAMAATCLLLALLHPDVKELIKKKVIHVHWNIFHHKHH